MKKFFYLALLALVTSCSGGGSFYMSGEISALIPGDTIMLFPYVKIKSDTPIFSSVVQPEQDKVDLKANVMEPQVAVFLRHHLDLHDNYGIVFLEEGDINVTYDRVTSRVIFTGTPLNDIFENYNLAKAEINAKAPIIIDTIALDSQRQAALDLVLEERAVLLRKTIDANLDNLVGAYLFVTEEFPKMEHSEVVERLSQFSGHLKKQKFMQEVIEVVDERDRTEPGQKYSDISLLDNSNKRHILSELLSENKYVLVSFWASWSAQCKSQIPYLQQAYTQYKDRGFEIYGVSMDTNRIYWTDMCNQMPWINVIRASGSSVATDYAVNALPTNFLISPEGIILARDLENEQVVAVVGELFK